MNQSVMTAYFPSGRLRAAGFLMRKLTISLVKSSRRLGIKCHRLASFVMSTISCEFSCNVVMKIDRSKKRQEMTI